MATHHRKLNLDKTELVFLPGKGCPHRDLSLTIDNTVVTPTRTARNLGVTLDDQLSFSANIASVARSCRFLLYNIRRIRPFLTDETAQNSLDNLECESAGMSISASKSEVMVLSRKREKICKLYERKLHGDFDTNSHIQKKKEFRNPSIYEKLIQFCSIDELGTNYPKDMFDPHGWSEDSYYEALAKAQKVEMDKLEKAKKERTKIEFVTGTKKGTNPSSTAASTTSTTTTTATEAQKRKSKWDSAVPVTLAQPTLLTTTATLPGVVSVTTTASGTKTTVISAVGTILKKAKQ
ncbi:SAP30-binding protein [Diretmus argenteus]